MTDQEKAQRLLDMASRRLASNEVEVLEAVRDGEPHFCDTFARLCTEFAEYLK